MYVRIFQIAPRGVDPECRFDTLTGGKPVIMSVP